MMITPEQRRNGIIGIIILCLLAIVLVWFFLFRSPAETPVELDPGAVPTANVKDNTTASPVAPLVSPEAANAKTVTRNFAERFGTYSTDVPFTNIEEVRELTTPEYFAQLQGQVYTLPEGTEYQGRTTRAIATEQTSGSEANGTMTFLVTVQHEMTSGNRLNPELYYQTAQVVVEKRGSVWLVSNFTWQ